MDGPASRQLACGGSRQQTTLTRPRSGPGGPPTPCCSVEGRIFLPFLPGFFCTGAGAPPPARTDADLVEDLRQVAFHRVLADGETAGNGLVRLTRHDRSQDVELAPRQAERQC